MGKVFNLSADSIFLIGDDGTVATAEDGNFNSYEMDSDISWTVSGNQLGSYRSTPMPAIVQQSIQPKFSKWKPKGSSL